MALDEARLASGAAEERYQKAKELYIHHATESDLKEALAIFEQLSEHQGAAPYAQRCCTLLRYGVGRQLELGAWEGRALRWRVAEARGKLRLLVAEEIVAERPYNELRVDSSWSKCSLRRWLNGEFLDGAFSRQERASIVAARVNAPRNPRFYSEGGAPSMDKIFILSPEEAGRYLPDAQDRARGEWWWLRMPGCNLLSAVSVCHDGSIYDIGINVNYERGGVRPAMWVLLRV